MIGVHPRLALPSRPTLRPTSTISWRSAPHQHLLGNSGVLLLLIADVEEPLGGGTGHQGNEADPGPMTISPMIRPESVVGTMSP